MLDTFRRISEIDGRPRVSGFINDNKTSFDKVIELLLGTTKYCLRPYLMRPLHGQKQI